jgi:hypothetical protein
MRGACHILLLSALGCGPVEAVAGPAAGRSATPAGPQAAAGSPDQLYTQVGLDALVAQASAALAEGAGVRLRQPVPALLLTAEQALERRKAYAATLAEGSGVTAGFEFLADFVFSQTMLGRYLPDEKVLYVIEDVVRAHAGEGRGARDFLFAVVAHELTHAHDDQVYGVFPDPVQLVERMGDGDYSELPTLQVTMSLLEGHATWAAELACHAAGTPPLEAPTLEDVRDAGVFDGGDNPLGQGLAAAGNTVARLKLVQYVQGREFCRRAMDFGGEAFMAQVFRSLPLTAGELADFERFKVRWAEEREAEDEAGEGAAGG